MISVIIIAKNEEQVIANAIKSSAWADEVLVIDNASEDATAQVAKRAGAKVTAYQGHGYSDVRNYGLKKAQGDWILYLDADETIPPRLKEEIVSVMANPQFSAYAIPRVNIILGKRLIHGGWYPDYVKRLFRKDSLKGWEGDLHEEPVFEGVLGHLKNHMVHHKYLTIRTMIDKTNKWSAYEAKLMYEANHPKMTIPRFFSAMLREFWLRMIRHMAFLDGPVGIIYALYQVFSRFVSYAKLWEMQERSK